MPLGSCWGFVLLFCFELLYLLSISFMGSFTSASSILVSPILKKQTKQQTPSPSRNPVSTLCLLASLFSLLLSNFTKKKKNHLYSLSFKGLHFVWNWKVTDDILVDKHSGLSPRQLPSLSHIIKLFSQQPESLLSFIGSYSVCPLQAFLPVRHLPFAFSLLAKVLSVHETVSSHDLAFEIDQNCILRHDDNWVLERPLKVEVRWSEKPENLQAVGPPSFSLLCSDLLY